MKVIFHLSNIKAMKTTIVNSIRILAAMIIMASVTTYQAKGNNMLKDKNKQDTTYVTFTGKVIDDNTRKPVVFANIYLLGSSLGTVTNADGEFVLKVPVDMMNRNVGFSYLGYKNRIMSLSSLSEKNNIIRLESTAVKLDEVVIRTDDPVELLKMALRRVNENYKSDPEMLIGFYRETVKQNRNYVAVAEAVLDVYKSSYNSVVDFDRVKIYKGRKSEDVKKMDTLLFKLQGGPRTSFLLDVVKNPGEILSEDYLNNYDFVFGGFATIDGRDNYVIEFNQKDYVDLALYKGKIYLDTKNMAFSRLEFSLSNKALDIADNELVRKKPMDLKVDVLGADYTVGYRFLNDKWYLNHVRSDLVFKCIWKKKRYNSIYTTSLEMAVTDRDTVNISKSKYRDQAKMTDIFADQVNYYKDENFWGEYNYIKPDESIESVIKKLNRKLKWQSITEN
jgi:hypothetical protein